MNYEDRAEITNTKLIPEDVLAAMVTCQNAVATFLAGDAQGGDPTAVGVVLVAALQLPNSHIVRHRASWNVKLGDIGPWSTAPAAVDISLWVNPGHEEWRCLVAVTEPTPNAWSWNDRPGMLAELAGALHFAVENNLDAHAVAALLHDQEACAAARDALFAPAEEPCPPSP